jgi:hypothetical protein
MEIVNLVLRKGTKMATDVLNLRSARFDVGRILKLFIVFLWASYLSAGASGETIYFLVAETTPAHNDSYVLPLTDADDIAHARDLIQLGPAAGDPIVVAQIACGADGINRDYLAFTKPASWWYVSNFLNFAESTIEILDGWPGVVARDCQSWIANTGGSIGFWSYTVVAELGAYPRHWRRDFSPDGDIDGSDFALFSQRWLSEDCNDPNWCNGRDIDQSGGVGLNDLAIFAQSYLSPFADPPFWGPICWSNPRQCHGDADGMVAGAPLHEYWVYTNDMQLFTSISYGGGYDPCVDFDRDGDVDDDDAAIIEIWFGSENIPADCPQESFR